MNKNSISLGRIFDIPIGLHYSWFLIFPLLTWALAVRFYPSEFKDWSTTQHWIVGGLTTIMLFVSVVLHEFGHGLAAHGYHIPVRSVTLFFFGGVAQLDVQPPTAAAELWIGLAGPMVSLALAIMFGAVLRLAGNVGWLAALAQYLTYINGALALISLFPGFPLDGSRVLRAIVWRGSHSLRRAMLVASIVSQYVALLFILWGTWLLFRGNFADGLWILFVGWCVESAAFGQAQSWELRAELAGHTVSEVMRRNYVAVPAETSLQEIVDWHILGAGQRSFVVERGQAVAGLVTLQNMRQVPRQAWATTTAADAMIPMGEVNWVRPETGLWPALNDMNHDGVSQLPVMVGRHIQGVLTREGIISLLRARRGPGFPPV